MLMRPIFDVPGVDRIAILRSRAAPVSVDAAESVTEGKTMQHKVVAGREWLVARKALLAKEKEFSKARDHLSAARRGLPWTKVEEKYVFEGENGPETHPTCSAGKASSLSTISCSDPVDQRLSQLLVLSRPFSTAPPSPRPARCTCRRFRAPLAKSRLTRNGWDGNSNGCRRLATTSTMISTSRSLKEEISNGAEYN
jgi:hypothetical protein